MAGPGLSKKVDNLLKSKPLKAKLTKFIDSQKKKYQSRGGSTNYPFVVADTAMLTEIADEFIDTVTYHMDTEIIGDAESVKKHARSLKAGPPVYHPNGTFTIEVYFTDDLSRPSLTVKNSGNGEKQYTGEGIKNIVALLNNGTDPGRPCKVFGIWESHDLEVWSIRYRLPLNFLQNALDDFNSNRWEDVEVYAEMKVDYGGNIL